ncbi:hypothetical protein RSP797_20830 [Ralstonia solanacearum]|uniref:Uncharacterized protein n=3 Tax=Ralstonia solanacearum TaxID=305 RepID=A0A5H2Q5X7_RALSL|nr:hypothetical protein C2124_17890 [Ralstonia solanacearum]EUJ13100.1 hypothetical protein RSP673_17775 [Ralstonia solanacearum P673]OAI67652.1 hypothetical protein RSP797_20830 [Ralstonia solanacearum]
MRMPSPLIDSPDTVLNDAGATAPTARMQLTPDDWIRAATDMLVTKSIALKPSPALQLGNAQVGVASGAYLAGAVAGALPMPLAATIQAR